MFGHNPAVNEDINSKQQIDEMLSIKPETVLEKILMKENIELKAEIEKLKKQIENERIEAEKRIVAADKAGSDRAARIYESHWPGHRYW